MASDPVLVRLYGAETLDIHKTSPCLPLGRRRVPVLVNNWCRLYAYITEMIVETLQVRILPPPNEGRRNKMARAPQGWDFIKVGGIYQYKEGNFIAMVEVTEDNSNKQEYSFKLKVLAANQNYIIDFHITAAKDSKIYSDMPQFYEVPEYLPLPVGTPWPYARNEKYKYFGL